MDKLLELIRLAEVKTPDNIKYIHSLIGRVAERDPTLTVRELRDSLEGVYNLCGEYQKIMVKLDAAIPELKLLLSSSVDKSKLEALAARWKREALTTHMLASVNEGLHRVAETRDECADQLQSLINERSGK